MKEEQKIEESEKEEKFQKELDLNKMLSGANSYILIAENYF